MAYPCQYFCKLQIYASEMLLHNIVFISANLCNPITRSTGILHGFRRILIDGHESKPAISILAIVEKS